jgi:hypothetical protein
MYRSAMLDALKEKKARLTVLMTESCHVYRESPTQAMAPPQAPPAEVPPIFKSLFFDYEGVVDFNTSCPGQTSKAYPWGGVYTLHFIAYLDENPSKRVSWKTLFDDLDSAVAEFDQNVYIWSLPKGSDHEAEERPNRWSKPNFRPENGDRIIFVNDIHILNEEHFHRVISNADPRVVLTVVDNKTGNRYYMMTDLLPQESPSRLGIEVENDERGGVKVTNVIPGTPGTRCSCLLNGDFRSDRVNSESN